MLEPSDPGHHRERLPRGDLDRPLQTSGEACRPDHDLLTQDSPVSPEDEAHEVDRPADQLARLLPEDEAADLEVVLQPEPDLPELLAYHSDDSVECSFVVSYQHQVVHVADVLDPGLDDPAVELPQDEVREPLAGIEPQRQAPRELPEDPPDEIDEPLVADQLLQHTDHDVLADTLEKVPDVQLCKIPEALRDQPLHAALAIYSAALRHGSAAVLVGVPCDDRGEHLDHDMMNPLLPDRRAEDLALLPVLEDCAGLVLLRPELKVGISSRSRIPDHRLHLVHVVVEVRLDLDDFPAGRLTLAQLLPRCDDDAPLAALPV